MTRKQIGYFGAIIGLALAVQGCIPSRGRCLPYMERTGYFCYKQHNYGRYVSSNYKQGVRDGCRTGEGYFRRNYSLSSYSEDYRKGWDAGRSVCRLIIPKEAQSSMRRRYR